MTPKVWWNWCGKQGSTRAILELGDDRCPVPEPARDPWHSCRPGRTRRQRGHRTLPAADGRVPRLTGPHRVAPSECAVAQSYGRSGLETRRDEVVFLVVHRLPIRGSEAPWP